MSLLLISHRGDTINFKENTLEAFKSAFAKGADGIELDVQLDFQKQVIVKHQYLGKEIKNPLLLETVLRQFKNKGLLEIELKGFEIELVEKVCKLIKKITPPQYTITASVLPILPYVRQALPQSTIGAVLKPYLFEEWMEEKLIKRLIIGYLKLTKANIANLYPAQFKKPLVDFIKKQGFVTHGHLYTDNPLEYQQLKSIGIEQCTFDNIDIIKNLNLKK